MDRAEFVHQKVVKWTLPAVQPGEAMNEALKRVVLPQGELAQFYDAEEAIRYIASIELKEGTVRGNHYHEVKREYIYILSGELLLALEEVTSHAREQLRLQGGDLVLIQPGIAHALQVTQRGMAVEFSPDRFNPADTFRAELAASS
jgi:quercetin dioxygenase-like cupin family protein